MKEADISRKIQLRHTEIGGRLFRNNVGLFKTKDGRTIKTGLCKGSSDLIGWMPVKITQEMVGKTIAVFTATEVKKNTKLSKDQELFINAVNNSGGIAFVSKSPEEHEQNIIDKIKGFINAIYRHI